MMDKVYVTQNDRLPKLRRTLRDASGPVNISAIGINVTFNMKMIDPPNTVVVSNVACAIVDPLIGLVEYAWGATDLATPGTYLGEFTVVYSGPLAATFPNTPDKIYIVVSPQIA